MWELENTTNNRRCLSHSSWTFVFGNSFHLLYSVSTYNDSTKTVGRFTASSLLFSIATIFASDVYLRTPCAWVCFACMSWTTASILHTHAHADDHSWGMILNTKRRHVIFVYGCVYDKSGTVRFASRNIISFSLQLVCCVCVWYWTLVFLLRAWGSTRVRLFEDDHRQSERHNLLLTLFLMILWKESLSSSLLTIPQLPYTVYVFVEQWWYDVSRRVQWDSDFVWLWLFIIPLIQQFQCYIAVTDDEEFFA